MKKILALLLTVALVCGLCVPAGAASAESALPIVFLTGIGQTWSHLVDENGEYKTETDKDGDTDFIEYNLFYLDKESLKEPASIANIGVLVSQLMKTLLLNRNKFTKSSLKKLASALFSRHILDENGNLPADVEDCARNYPLSEYNEIDRRNFFRSIPCQSVLDGVREEDIYCFYHNAFSYIERDADDLDTFISDVVLRGRDVDQVILVPMSMGAAVASAYLAKYADKGQVKRVVSIVGAWNGSDLVADLVEGSYADDSREMWYNMLPDKIEAPWGDLAGVLMRLVSHDTLRSFIDMLREAVVETLVLPTPSMLALIPAERYPAIEQKYLSGSRWEKVREQAHAYYEAQRTFPQRVRELEQKGMEFYFLSGYDLAFGSADDQYFFFRFLRSTATTNGDEIIQISSTAPGTTYAPAGTSLGRTGPYVSPDGSVDLSTSIAPDRTWCFYRQRHQLDYNNTALRLAMEIATGRVTDVASSAEKYPQFNGARDLKPLLRGDDTLIHRLQAVLDAHPGETMPDVQQALDDCRAALESTHNDPVAEAAVLENARKVLLNYEPQPEPQAPSRKERIEKAVVEFLKLTMPPLRALLERIYGDGGRGDRR